MINTTSTNTLVIPIFEQESQALDTSLKTILRLKELDKLICGTSRSDHSTKLKSMCMTVINSKDPLEETRKKVLADLKRDFKFSRTILNYCTAKVEEIKNLEDLKVFANEFFLDLQSIQADSPLRKSHDGQKGPTLLVAYPRCDPLLNSSELHTSVIKWSTWNEACAARIYGVFSSVFPNSYIVPRVSVFDPELGVIETAQLTREKLEDQRVKVLVDTLSKIKDQMKSEDKQILLMERINGAHLFDFAQLGFDKLSNEQKKTLYRKLGELAIIDLLIGNGDRLIRTYLTQSKEKFQIVNAESNLGNVLVTMSSNGESLDIYAIDNSIDDVLMGKNGRNLEYNTFLRELLQNDKMTDMLTNAIIASMEKAISSRIESICEKLKSSEAQAESLKLKTQFEPFLKALSSEETKNEMRKGLQEMSNNLNRLQSSWNDGTLDSLKEYLKSTYPELLDILSGRFETLKSARSQL